MSTTQRMTLAEIENVALSALSAAGASPEQARPLAAAVAAAEADGIASHGLAYVPTYCEHLRCGKVDGKAVPVVTKSKPALLTVDAKSGFAHPAINVGFAQLIPLAREMGVAGNGGAQFLQLRRARLSHRAAGAGRIARYGFHQCAGLDRAVRRPQGGDRHQSVCDCRARWHRAARRYRSTKAQASSPRAK